MSHRAEYGRFIARALASAGATFAALGCGSDATNAGGQAGDAGVVDTGLGALDSTIPDDDAGAEASAPVDASEAQAPPADAARSGDAGSVTVYDLQSDWSDTTNPGAVWAYVQGTTSLPHVSDWLGGGGGRDASVPQPAWARDPGADFGAPNEFLPAVFKTSGLASWTTPAGWVQSGDVVVHTTDSANGVGAGPAAITWTSPVRGTVRIHGGVWMGTLAGRSNSWSLSLGAQRLAGGELSSGDGYSRAAPFAFSAGLDGGVALEAVPVSVGDVIRLQLVKSSTSGYFVGVVETITATAIP